MAVRDLPRVSAQLYGRSCRLIGLIAVLTDVEYDD